MLGAFDSVTLRARSGELGGWAYQGVQGKKNPVVNVSCPDLIGYEVTIPFADSPDERRLRFNIAFKSLGDLLAVVLGESKFYCISGTESGEIRVASRVRSQVLKVMLDHFCQEFDDSDRVSLVSRVLDMARTKTNIRVSGEAAEILIQPGAMSYDRTALLGRDGYFFLYGGSNIVHELYGRALNEDVVKRWLDLIVSRGEMFAKIGVKFTQIIVPEKQSVLVDLYPYSIDSPTPLAKRLISALDDSPYFLDLQRVLEGVYQIKGINPYRKVDSHLSFHGAMYSALALCENLNGKPVDIEVPALVENIIGGDLGNKFGYGQIVERALLPDVDSCSFSANSPMTVRSYDPKGRLGGTLRVWENENPIIRKNVVVFGNSMFERGATPFGLSWWLSRIFEKMAFVWSPSVDLSVISDFSPDLVVGQTVERFLGSVPAS